MCISKGLATEMRAFGSLCSAVTTLLMMHSTTLRK